MTNYIETNNKSTYTQPQLHTHDNSNRNLTRSQHQQTLIRKPIDTLQPPSRSSTSVTNPTEIQQKRNINTAEIQQKYLRNYTDTKARPNINNTITRTQQHQQQGHDNHRNTKEIQHKYKRNQT